MATAQLGYFSTRGSCMTWQQSVAFFRWCVLVSSSITWVEMAVFDLKLGLVVVRNVFPCGQEHLSLCGWRDTIAECGKDREHRPYITTGNMYARQWKHLSRFPAAAPEHQLPAAGSCPAARPHQEAPRGERPAGFHRINKTVTHKDRRRKGQTLVHNRRATAQPKELSECSWRTDSHTHTQTSTSNLCTCSYWRLCVSLTSAWFSSFGVKRFIQETLTHLAILYKQHADGVLGAEVEYVNVVLNGHLREWLHPRRGGREEDDRMRNKKQYVGNYFTSALQGWALLVYVCCLLNQEGCSPEKSLPLSQTHRPPITLDLKSKFAKEYQQTSLDYIKHNSFLHTA